MAGADDAASLKVRNVKGIHEDDGGEGEQEHSLAQPLDALAVERVLASMGADKFEPRVVAQLQEFVHRGLALSFQSRVRSGRLTVVSGCDDESYGQAT